MTEISVEEYPVLKFLEQIKYAVNNAYLWINEQQATEYAMLLCIKCGNDSKTKERFIYVRDMLQMRINLPEILPPNEPVLTATFSFAGMKLFFQN